MNGHSDLDSSFMLWTTPLILGTILAIFAIRAFASMRVAKSGAQVQDAQVRIERLESELAETKGELKSIRKMLDDV